VCVCVEDTVKIFQRNIKISFFHFENEKKLFHSLRVAWMLAQLDWSRVEDYIKWKYTFNIFLWLWCRWWMRVSLSLFSCSFFLLNCCLTKLIMTRVSVLSLLCNFRYSILLVWYENNNELKIWNLKKIIVPRVIFISKNSLDKKYCRSSWNSREITQNIYFRINFLHFIFHVNQNDINPNGRSC
jgi:hypothetical protein